jgi:hypothetical protein
MDVVEIRNTTHDRDQLHLVSNEFGTYETNAFAGTLSTLDIQPILFGLEDGIFTVLGGPIQIGFGISGADLDPPLASTFFVAGMIVPMGPPEFFAAPAPTITAPVSARAMRMRWGRSSSTAMDQPSVNKRPCSSTSL